jgi:hypothetical protein
MEISSRGGTITSHGHQHTQEPAEKKREETRVKRESEKKMENNRKPQ